MPEERVPPLPPELLNNDPGGFAWGVWHERAPRLVFHVRDAHPYGPRQRAALGALLAEIPSGVMQPLGVHAHGHGIWAAWGAKYFGKPWLDTPFLWSESFFYRRLLDAVGFFEPGPWRWLDPFEYLKSADLCDPALEPDLAALGNLQQLSDGDQDRAILFASLWGNRADLSFRMGAASGSGDIEPDKVIADQSADLWGILRPGARVIVATDNAGRELLADLVLADRLVRHRHVESVSLHVKPYPYYVSDATGADAVACLRRLAATPGAASQIAHRLYQAMAEGRVNLSTHEFYCAPWSYHRMPADLAARFGQASVTIFKGDLHYRRLAGDRDWPPATPFPEVAAYFPGPVAVLRTLKSDVVTGLDAATVADLDATGQRWRTDGSHALIQVRP